MTVLNMIFGCGPCNKISWMKKNNWKADIKKKGFVFGFCENESNGKQMRLFGWFTFCSYSSWFALVLSARVIGFFEMILLWQNWLAKEHKRDNILAHTTRSCSLKPLIHILQSTCLNQVIIPISWFTAQSIMIAIPWGKRMVNYFIFFDLFNVIVSIWYIIICIPQLMLC